VHIIDAAQHFYNDDFLAAALDQWALHQSALMTAMAVTTGGLGAAIRVVAGVSQLTPLKRAHSVF